MKWITVNTKSRNVFINHSVNDINDKNVFLNHFANNFVSTNSGGGGAP